MNYKTTFKKSSKFRVYRIKNNFKCVANCLLQGIDKSDEKLAEKLQKKFKDIRITDKGIEFEMYTLAKCHPNDSFDETKGRTLAESRCKRKVFTRSKKILECIFKYKEAEYQKAQKSLKRYNALVDVETDHVMRLSGKKVYLIKSIIPDTGTEGVSNVKLVDIEYDPKSKGSIDTTANVLIEAKILSRANVEQGDYIYFNTESQKKDERITQASQLIVNKIEERKTH